MTEIQKESIESTFSGFGKPFQEKLAFMIAEDPAFANQIRRSSRY